MKDNSVLTVSDHNAKISLLENDEFRGELENLLNRHCAENGSNTPDFILAKYLIAQLSIWDQCVNRREEWYGRANEFEQNLPRVDAE